MKAKAGILVCLANSLRRTSDPAASASSQNAPSRPTHASDQRPEALL